MTSTERAVGHRCPLCSNSTKRKTRRKPERCVRPDCPAQHIERNNRGWAWAWGSSGRLEYTPDGTPRPHDVEPGRALIHSSDPSRYPGYSPDEMPVDFADGFQIIPLGTLSRNRKREARQ